MVSKITVTDSDQVNSVSVADSTNITVTVNDSAPITVTTIGTQGPEGPNTILGANVANAYPVGSTDNGAGLIYDHANTRWLSTTNSLASSLNFKIPNLTFDTGQTVSAILDEDNLGSDSNTALATQQSIKAYVDTQITAQDMDFQGDSGGALSIDLDSETFTVAGGTGIDTVGSSNTITVSIDSTVATLTGTQTLTNKTLTAPILNTVDINGGDISSDTTINKSPTITLAGRLSGSVTLTNLADGTLTATGDFALGTDTTGNYVAEISAGEGIDVSGSGSETATVTISAEDATSSNKGIASFDATDFSVTSGAVTLQTERIQDIVGAMVTGNTESGIDVTYDDTNGNLDFNADDFVISLAGDLGGSVTITNLASATLTATIQADSVALGTDTTGNYLATLTASNSGIDVANSGAESAAVTVGLNTEYVQDLVGAMVSTNTESGIDVSYDDTNGKLDFNVNDPVITLSGDVSGSGTLTNLGDLTITTTIGANSVALGTDTTGNYIATATAGEGIDISGSGSESAAITISAEDATDSNKGIASFSSDYFTVSSGAVTLSTTASTAELNYLDITTLGTVEASKAVTADSNADVLFGDDDKLKFGDDTDLQIYYNNSNDYSYIHDTSTQLRLRSAIIRLSSENDNVPYISASNSGVTLTHAGSTKLQTTSGGITVTGAITGDLTGDCTGDLTGNVTGDLTGNVDGAIEFDAQAGEALSKGDAVYISGISGNKPIVSKADADDSAKMPSFGLAKDDATLNANVTIITFGTLSGLDTSGFSAGDTLFINTTAGGLTASAPSGESSLIQNIGIVQRSHASAGSIKVGGAGRTNAVPNLNDGKIFLGNSSNQSVSTTLDTSVVPENTNLYHTTERVEDVVGGMVTGNTETGIEVTYQDSDGTLDFVVQTLNQDTTGNAGTATALETARTIALSGDVTASGVSFDGTGDITLSTTIGANSVALGTDTTGNYIATITGTTNEVEVSGSGSEGATVTIGLPNDVTIGNNLTVTGNLTVSGTTTTINTTNLDVADATIRFAKNATTLAATDGAGIEFGASSSKPTITWDNTNSRITSNKTFHANSLVGALTGNADTATTLETARTIHGVSFDGSADISLTEEIQDTVGAMFSGNTQTNVTVTYQDSDGTIDVVVDSSSATETLTNKTITNPTISDPEFSGTLSIAPSENTTQTLTVTVASKTNEHPYDGGSSSAYVIDGVESPYLTLTPDTTYRFDQSDSSNSGHPLRFYYESDKTTSYTTGVTTNGTAGSAGAYTEIKATASTPTVLFYQCSAHSLMGNRVNFDTRNFTGFDTDDLSEGSSNQYFTNARSRGSVSVGSEGTASGDGNLGYNSSTGVFTYTPPVLSGLSGDTDDVTEGSTNLYHTSERVQDVVGGQIVTNGSHTGISFAYDDAGDGAIDATVSLSSFDTDNLSEGSSNLYHTTERVQDIIGGALATNGSHTGLSAAYDDAGDGAIDLSIDTGGVTNAMLAGSIANAKLANSSITVTDGTNSTATALGGTITFTAGEGVDITESSGTITIAGEDATSSNKGIASFTSDFSVSSGAVSLANSGVTANSYGSATAIPVITVDAKGRLTAVSTASISTSFTLSDGTNTQSVAGGDTLTVSGTSNEVDVVVSATDTLTIGLPNDVTISNDLTVSGNLTVTGTTTQTGSVITDNNFTGLTNANTGNTTDFGFYGKYVESSTTKYAGIFYDASTDNTFRLFVDTQTVPSTTVNTGATGYTAADLVIGGLTTSGITIGSTAVTSTAAELNILDGVTSTATELNILDGVTSTTAELNILDGVTSSTAELNILDGVTSSTAELNILDGVTSTTAELNILDGVTSTTAELNILDGVTSTATELNILDGVTATTAEINIIDGDTSATSTTLADADRVVVNDAGVMKQVALTDFETYFESALDTLSNVTSVGTLSSLTVSGDITIDTNTLKVDSSNNRVGIKNSSPDVTLDIGSATDAIHVPVGTTAQRPTGANGYFRYNSTDNQFEGYADGAWGAIAGSGGGSSTLSVNTYTGDGSTTAFTLSQAPASEDNLIVFIEGVYQNPNDFVLNGTTLTLDVAPANGRKIVAYHVSAAVSGNNLNHDQFTFSAGELPAFTLSIAPIHENNTQVFIDGVYQQKDSYAVSGTTLTLDASPANGATVEVMTFTQTDINTFPASGISSLTEVTAVGADHLMIFDATDSTLKKALVSDVIETVGSNPTFTTAAITNTSTDDSLTITTTEDSSTAAPVITLKRNSGSPADGDYLGQLKFKGENDADQEVIYAKVTGKISDASDTTEDGLLEFALRKAGSNNIGMRLTSTDLKLINGTGLEVDADLTVDTNTLHVDSTNNRVGVGTVSPDFLMDIEGSNTQLKVGTASQDGGFLTSTDNNQLIASGGFYYNGTNFIATATSASGVSFDNGGTFFYNNTSLTDGNSFTLTETVRITDSGNVGIGTTSPSSKLHVSVAGDPEVRLTNTSASQTLRLDHNSIRTMQSSAISIMTNDNSSQQFRISAAGRMSLGANTGTAYSSQERVGIRDGSGQTFGLGIQMGGTPLGLWHTSNSGTFVAFAYGGSGSASGSITFSSGTTTYGTGSDYRLKENVDYTWDATTRLKQLKPCRFNWIEDDTDTLVDGFLAHEVANVVPEAVVGEKDATYTAAEALENPNTQEGDAKIQMMDNSKLVPLLVKTIQELEARIETLENA